MVYVCSLPLTPAVILSFISSQMAPLMQAYKKHELYFTGLIPVVIWYMNARSYDELELPQPPFNLLPAKNVRIYIETAIVVVISYVSLLIVNWSHIWLVVFPVIAIGFIVALCSQLSHQGGSQGQSNHGEGEATAPSGKKAEGLEAVALLPYWALCVMGQFQADKFAVSQFLLFFSFMLGALTMMITRLVGLATAAHRGIRPASELLRKASLVVLLVAVHAVAAELLGENALLYCLPEIVPVLLWLSVRLDCGDDRAAITVTAAESIKLVMGSRVLNLFGAAAAAALAAMLASGYMDESVLYWCGKALVSCCFGSSNPVHCFHAVPMARKTTRWHASHSHSFLFSAGGSRASRVLGKSFVGSGGDSASIYISIFFPTCSTARTCINRPNSSTIMSKISPVHSLTAK